MRRILLLLLFFCLEKSLVAQNVYTIKADSVKITNCDSAELILENHTQNVPGFLFNTGNGRTLFKRGAVKLNDSLYLIGADTLKIRSNPWVQGGNAFGATGVLGTLDNHHLDFYANDSLHIRLTNTGNLLLGTTTDQGQKLQVNGTSLFSGNMYVDAHGGDGNGQLFLQNAAGDFSDYIGTEGYNMVFHTRNAFAGFFFRFGGSSSTMAIGGGGAGSNVELFAPSNLIDLSSINSISDGGSNSIYMRSNNYSGGDGIVVQRGIRSQLTTDPIFTVRQSDTTVFDALKNGNVGIGTSTPSAQLHTTGSVRLAGLTSDSSQTRVLVSDAGGNLYYRSAASLTTNDMLRSSLAVNGVISAKRLRLSQTAWPDYVFVHDYHLPSLRELEQYIRQNNHLPGIPSATLVETNGIDVGENQAMLLKKIEELTLYIIAQNKELEIQKDVLKELGSMKREIAELRKSLRRKSNR